MNRVLHIGLAAALLAAAPFHAAFAQRAPDFGSAESFALLAGTAVTCTDSTVTGDVGVYPGTAITQTNCTIDGTTHSADNVAAGAYTDFLATYAAIGAMRCDDVISGDLAGMTLTRPGVYCVDAASTTTNGTLTLSGGGQYIFKIGTSGTGALTGTGLTVVLEGGTTACDVYWWVAEAATLTDSAFVGTILAGAAITVTRGTYEGDAYAQAAVTVTGATITGCEDGSNPPAPSHERCNQGVGNGPESCDPGNSNQGDPSRSNDEVGGTPGAPGRQGGNGR